MASQPAVERRADRLFKLPFSTGTSSPLRTLEPLINFIPSILLAACPLLLWYSLRRPQVVHSSKLLWFKMLAAIGLLLAEVTAFVLQSSSLSVSELTSLPSISASSMAAVLYFEHKHTLRSSGYIATWLIVAIVYDIARATKYTSIPDFEYLFMYTMLGTIMKAVIMALEEVPKRSAIIDADIRQTIGREATSGVISRSLLLWLSNTLCFGFQNTLTVEQLENLEPDFSSEDLHERFGRHWTNADQQQHHGLAIACLQFFFFEFIAIFVPRLGLAAFSLSQPVFVYNMVGFADTDFLQHRGLQQSVLVGFGIIVYSGIAITRVVYSHKNTRLRTLVRGVLSSHIYQKSLKILHTRAQNTEAMVHLNSDVEGVVNGLVKLHDSCIGIVEFCVLMFMLAILVGAASILIILPTIINLYAGWYIAEHMPDDTRIWKQRIQARVAKTSAMLHQIRAVRMVGLEKIFFKPVQDLHNAEVAASKGARVWAALMIATGVFCNTIPGPLVIGGGLFLTLSSHTLSVQDTFTVLAIVAVMKHPLMHIIDAYPNITSTLVSLRRIMEYLQLPEVQDQRDRAIAGKDDVPGDGKGDVKEKLLEADPRRPTNCVIELRDASLAVQGTDKIILQHLTLELSHCDVLMVIGGTGLGKSVFLDAIIGEGNVVFGSLYVEPSYIAYCDQIPWIWSSTIQDNIVARSEFDAAWYEAVLQACCLRDDLQRLVDGDMSNCMNLSSGQKAKVAIARAVYARRRITVFDDVFGTLDGQTLNRIASQLLGTDGLLKRSQTTVVLATHSIELLQVADQIMVVQPGKTATIHPNSNDPIFSQQLTVLMQRINRFTQRAVRKRPAAAAGEAVAETRARDVVVVDEEDVVARDRTIRLYLFYLRSFPLFGLTASMVYIFCASLSESSPTAYVSMWFGTNTDSKLPFIGYALLGPLTSAFTWLSLSNWFLHLVPSSAKTLHSQVLDTMLSSTFHALCATDHGALMNLFSDDMILATQGLPRDFVITVYTFFNFLILAGIAFVPLPYSPISIPLFLAIMGLVQHFHLRTTRQLKQLDIQLRAPLTAQFNETTNGIRHIRSFGWQGQSLQKTCAILDDSQKPYYHMNSIQQWLGLVVDMIAVVFVAVLICASVHWHATSSRVGLAAVSLILLSLESSMFVQSWTKFEISLGGLSRVEKFVRKTPREQEPDRAAIRLPAKQRENGRVKFQNVTASYGGGDVPPALNDASFTVPAGWKVGVVGQTGSGKSSLLLSLLGFLQYTGQITIDDVDIASIPKQILRSRYITTVSQDLIDFDESVKYNLCPWTMSKSQAPEGNPNNIALACLLTELGLWDVIGGEMGLDVKVSALGLSQGQKQLFAIARGCMQHMTFDGNIVLMDEVTSNLDQETQENVVRVLKEVFEDATVFMVAHRTETLEGVDLIMTVENGSISMTTQEDSDRLQRERRDRERQSSEPHRIGWSPGNYPPELAYFMQMAEYNDAQHLVAQRRGADPSQR